MSGEFRSAGSRAVFTLRDEVSVGEHHFAIFDCHVEEDEDLVETLSRIVREIYLDRAELAASLKSALTGLDDLFEIAEVESAISAVVDVSIPEPGVRVSQPWLDVARNELAEIIAYVAAEEIYQTILPVKRIRMKEVASLPTRGMDLMALDTNSSEMRLFVGEVKASEQATSPPDVVDVGDRSLRGQIIAALRNKTRILTELAYLQRHAASEHRQVVSEAILRCVADRLPVVAFPVLVRSDRSLGHDDFGSFHSSHADFAPAVVKFCLAVLPSAIDTLAADVYVKARAS